MVESGRVMSLWRSRTHTPAGRPISTPNETPPKFTFFGAPPTARVTWASWRTLSPPPPVSGAASCTLRETRQSACSPHRLEPDPGRDARRRPLSPMRAAEQTLSRNGLCTPHRGHTSSSSQLERLACTADWPNLPMLPARCAATHPSPPLRSCASLRVGQALTVQVLSPELPGTAS